MGRSCPGRGRSWSARPREGDVATEPVGDSALRTRLHRLGGLGVPARPGVHLEDPAEPGPAAQLGPPDDRGHRRTGMTMRDNARTTKFHPGAEQPRPVSGSNPPRRRGRSPLWTRLTMLGPAFVAAVAYVDPGNVATNLQAGARYGYLLVWVLVLVTASAGIVQFLSAKLGVITGASLPDLVG